MHNSEQEPQEHVELPDQHAIDDWFLYGPQNQEIEILVRKLTIGQGLRLSSVEALIVAALEQKLHEITWQASLGLRPKPRPFVAGHSTRSRFT